MTDGSVPGDDVGDLLGTAAGLSADLLAVYRLLVATPGASAGHVAATLDVPRGAARERLAALAERGFASVSARPDDGGDTGDDDVRYVAAPPSVVLGGRLAAHEVAVRRAQAELDTLEEMYRHAGAEGGADDVVQVVRGAAEVAHWFARVQSGARGEVRAFVQHPVAVTGADENHVEDELVRRGVRYRVLFEQAALDTFPGGLDAFAAGLRAGESARVIDALPLRMVIADDGLALLPVLSAPERASAAAMLVRPSALLTGLIALFDTLWTRAAPVILDAPSGVPSVGVADDVDARLLSLLLAGSTDESAAHQLGISTRTVQRRIRELMDRAGVRTRAQLGWHAARAGWGDEPPGAERL
ncbi:sugar-specific transcriptional regulator TrmB [Isoptericola jiangsuensis]|uniref:Sugar-specific transcriptional regulator TrmB n=1 Tax=Isoptericola jiangsuensis TaxID=548579 RepID=A0A2A9ERJ3_9MICO|nr:hypothetical protein [Isoptericola jiangsuensis]PFG41373.1 sugar-specific transcriptional regulator TrmB [Isoptericola jiangsuensis]